MIPLYFLLSSLFGLVCAGKQAEDVFHCEAENVTVSGSDQRLLLSWTELPWCFGSSDEITYELLVLMGDTEVHHSEVAVTADQIGSVHTWRWTPRLSLHCAPHSLRLRLHNNNYTSQWKQQEIQTGNRDLKRKRVYPRDGVFRAGSTASFCCVPAAGERVQLMYVSGSRGSRVSSPRVGQSGYVIRLQLEQPADVCLDVKCRTDRSTYGACAYVGYPPDDRDLQCETRDLRSVECVWTVGRHTHLSLRSPTQYHLLASPCLNGTPGKCTQSIQLEAEVMNWTLKAQNQLGEVELRDQADLTQRVHMFAPDGVAAFTVSSRNVIVGWTWSVPSYISLSLICQVHISHSDTTSTSEHFGVGLRAAFVSDLTPNMAYTGKVRCGNAQPFWKWGDWSRSFVFTTQGDVAAAVDVWMQRKDNHTIIIWKFVRASQRHGDIIDYAVSWRTTGEGCLPHRATVAASHPSFTLTLDTREEHIVTVTARNINGSSSPSSITIPPISPDEDAVNTSWITGSNGSFSLSWPRSPAASCGYTVDWCPTFGDRPVEWLRAPPNQTSVTINSKSFTEGIRYSLSISACTSGAPVLLQKMEGYVQEKKIEDHLFKPLHFKQHQLDMEIFWDSFSLRKQSAFIQGYVLYYQELNGTILTVETDDPYCTSITARDLSITWYIFTVTAVTSVGECGSTSITATLNSQNDFLMNTLVSLLAVFGLISLTMILCYKHWSSIKDKVYPPIPKPVLPDKWLASLGQAGGHSPHSEADPELQLLYGALVTDVTRKDMHVFTPTFIDPYSRHPPKYSPLPTPAFPNPSYNLLLQTETPAVMEVCDEYQPQGLQRDNGAGGPMYYEPSYIPLPAAS